MSEPNTKNPAPPSDAQGGIDGRNANPLYADGYGWLIVFIIVVLVGALILALTNDRPADAAPIAEAPEAFMLVERTVMKDRYGASVGWLTKGTILVPTGAAERGRYEAVGPDGKRVWLDDTAPVVHNAQTFKITRSLADKSDRGASASSILRAFRSAFEGLLSPAARVNGARGTKNGNELVWRARAGTVACTWDGKRPSLSSVEASDASFPLPLSLRIGMDMDAVASALGSPMWVTFSPAPPAVIGWRVTDGAETLSLSFSQDMILTGVSYRNGNAKPLAVASNDVFGPEDRTVKLGDGEGKITMEKPKTNKKAKPARPIKRKRR